MGIARPGAATPVRCRLPHSGTPLSRGVDAPASPRSDAGAILRAGAIATSRGGSGATEADERDLGADARAHTVLDTHIHPGHHRSGVLHALFTSFPTLPPLAPRGGSPAPQGSSAGAPMYVAVRRPAWARPLLPRSHHAMGVNGAGWGVPGPMQERSLISKEQHMQCSTFKSSLDIAGVAYFTRFSPPSFRPVLWILIPP